MLVLHLVLVSIGQFLDYGSSIELSGRGRGMLYPHESESRQIQLLDGMWNFKADASDCRCEGLTQQWYLKKLSEVPYFACSNYRKLVVLLQKMYQCLSVILVTVPVIDLGCM